MGLQAAYTAMYDMDDGCILISALEQQLFERIEWSDRRHITGKTQAVEPHP